MPNESDLGARLTRIQKLLRGTAKLRPTAPGREGSDVEDPDDLLDALDARIEKMARAYEEWAPHVDHVAELKEKVSDLEETVSGVEPEDLKDLTSRVEDLEKADLPARVEEYTRLLERIDRVEEEWRKYGDRQESGPTIRELSERLDEIEHELGTNLSFPEALGYEEPPPRDYVTRRPRETESEALTRLLVGDSQASDADAGADESDGSRVSDEQTLVQFIELERWIEALQGEVNASRREIADLKAAARERPREVVQLEDRLASALRYTASNVDDERLDLPSPTALRARLRADGFLIDLATATELLKALNHNRLVILEGPPGSGKTTLAKLLARILTETEPDCAEVSAEWTHYEAIGGVRMIGRAFAAHLGAVSRALLTSIELRGRHWLILDEINRGDFASFLSGAHQLFELPDGALTLDLMFPERADPRGVLKAPPAFRVLGTMNVSDKRRLFQVSDALKRRSKTIVLRPPSADDEISLALLQAERDAATNSRHVDHDQLHRVAAQGLQFVQRIREIGAKSGGCAYASIDVGTWTFVDCIRCAAEELCSNMSSKGIDSVLDKAIATTLLDRLSIDSPDLARHILIAIEQDWPLTRGALEHRIRRTSVY